MGIISDIKEDFLSVKKNDPAIKSNIELFFNYPGLIAIVNYRIANKLYKRNFRVLARIIMGFTQFITNIDIHPACSIGKGIFIDHGIGVVIGETAILHDNITIYQGVTLGGVTLESTKRHPTIKSGVTIGAGAKILGNITIGENVKIGANSVVIRDVPNNATAVGIPARVIKKGRTKESNAMNKIPDIDKQLFNYMLKRMQILESKIDCNDNKKELEDLDKLYDSFLKSIKD